MEAVARRGSSAQRWRPVIVFESFRRGPGRFRPVKPRHHVQRQVDSRTNARAGQDTTRVDPADGLRTLTEGNSFWNRSMLAQCVVASKPSRSPAWAKRKLPVQTLATSSAVREVRRIQSTTWARRAAAAVPGPPGTIRTSNGGLDSSVWSGITFRPYRHVTALLVSAIVATVMNRSGEAGAGRVAPKTSNGPTKSSGSHSGKRRIPTRRSFMRGEECGAGPRFSKRKGRRAHLDMATDDKPVGARRLRRFIVGKLTGNRFADVRRTPKRP